jgi:hypothetical protein
LKTAACSKFLRNGPSSMRALKVEEYESTFDGYEAKLKNDFLEMDAQRKCGNLGSDHFCVNKSFESSKFLVSKKHLNNGKYEYILKI